MSIVQVALPVPMRRLFDYVSEPLPEGCRVEVTFGNRKLVGVVVSNINNSDLETEKLKPIERILESEPVLSKSMLSLGLWLAQYLHHPVGDVLTTMLPAALRRPQPITAKQHHLIKLSANGKAQLLQPTRAKRQMQLLTMLADEAVDVDRIKAHFSAAILKACKDKGWVTDVWVEHVPDTNWHQCIELGPIPVPTTEQSIAIAAITTRLDQYTAFLLEGVTGSGKTEVYLQSIQPVLLSGKQVLVLVPEIGLTPQTVERFRLRFGIDVGVLHSGLNDPQRLDVWRRARTGELGLVIGTRSAVFTPFKQLGLVIVDEEHDESYKQQDGPRYHARDVAVMRAQRNGIPLILGSATPSLESLNNALHHKYQLLQLHDRTGNASLAAQHLMDMRAQSVEYGLSESMLKKMQTHLSAGGQVMVFVNRRGFAPSLVCHQCGHVEECPRCDAPFTVHKSVARLHCHRCDNSRSIPRQCQQCHSSELLSQGVGTEQLEQGLQRLFVNYSTVRIDSDSVRGKDKLANVITAINQNKHQILIGTQILSKGHHFPLVSLVVILNVDAALFSVDLRASEKLAQLVTQLAGRAGRENRNGEMWLQTHHPDHPLLQDLLNNGYAHFARHALSERKAAIAPPFVQQAVIRAEAQDSQQVFDFLAATRSLLQTAEALTLIGPFPAIQFKRGGRFRMLLTLQAHTRKQLHGAIAMHLDAIEHSPLSKKVRWSIDIAPTELS